MSARAVIVGGGITGLAAAWRLKLRRPDLSVTVLEAAARFGGKLISEHREGFVIEAAADGFLARKPPALEWVHELGMESELILPRAEHRFSHVLWNGTLHRMPEGFSGLVPTDADALKNSTLLTSQGADRVAAEAAMAPRLNGPEESIREFFTRRFGAEVFERLLEPLLAGIYAGDSNRLSADAAFGQLTAIERSGRSLMQALAPAPGPRASDPAFRSFSGGMARLPLALEKRLRTMGVDLVAQAPVTSIERSDAGFTIWTPRAQWQADSVVVALPPRPAGAVVMPVSSDLAAVLSRWPVSSVANLTLAFDARGVELPAGSGFVAPHAGGAPATAGTWSSHKWPHRAPQDTELARFYFGGARDPQGWRTSDEQMLDRALDLIESLTGRRPRPLWYRAFRWKDAFAQPNLGHADRHRHLIAAAVPGLVLAGGYFAGVGIPDCLASAQAAAESVDRHLKTGDT